MSAHPLARDIDQFAIAEIRTARDETRMLDGAVGIVFHKWDDGLFYSIALPKYGHKIMRARELRVIGKALRLTDPPKYLDMYESFESQGRTNMEATT